MHGWTINVILFKLFRDAFNVVEHQKDKYVPIITYIVTATISCSQAVSHDLSCHVTETT